MGEILLWLPSTMPEQSDAIYYIQAVLAVALGVISWFLIDRISRMDKERENLSRRVEDNSRAVAAGASMESVRREWDTLRRELGDEIKELRRDVQQLAKEVRVRERKGGLE